MRILLSGAIEHQNYLQALGALGAEGMGGYLPPIDAGYDGLILCGGGDIAPERYGEEPRGSRQIDPRRDEVEMALLAAYIGAGKPILGICRGHQLINIFFGGTLLQDLSEESGHGRGQGRDGVHPVTARRDSVVGELYGERFSVNSAHHQAIGRLGAGLRATAWAEGGVVEAIEHETLAILGVQWHPERMSPRHRWEGAEAGDVLLARFLEMCSQGRKG